MLQRLKLLPLPLCMLLTACASGPDYVRPTLELPQHYQAVVEHDAARLWQPVSQVARVDQQRWWLAWQDEQLSALVERVAVDNQNVRAMAAALTQAQAALAQSRAQSLPQLQTSLAANRNQRGELPSSKQLKFDFAAQWELDVWGRLSRGEEAARASVAAHAADLAAARLSAQATLMQTYVQWRFSLQKLTLIEQSLAAYRRMLQLTQERYQAGAVARGDVAHAQLQLANAEAQQQNLHLQRQQLQHAMALLVGVMPGQLQLNSDGPMPQQPSIASGIPAQLLQRRPDIQASERRVAAANARIGVASSAWYPNISLGAGLGWQHEQLSQLLATPQRYWSLGPVAALALFDAGTRSAQVAAAAAEHAAATAQYRQTVLGAMQEVEDASAGTYWLQQAQQAQNQAIAAAAELLRINETQYRAGRVDFLQVASAQTSLFAAQLQGLASEEQRIITSITLARALGGAWQAE